MTLGGEFIIKRLQLCIEINKSSNNKDYKQFLNDFIYNHLVRCIEQAIANIYINTDDIITVQDPQIINIDKLSINQDDFYSQFTQKLHLDFANRMQKIIEDRNQDKVTLVEYKKDSFVLYLKTGKMENDILHNDEDINILYDEILQNEEAVRDVFIQINSDSNAIKRFFGIISKEHIQSTVAILYLSSISKINEIVEDIIEIKKNIFTDYYNDDVIKKNVCQYLLTNYGNSVFDSDFFILDLIKTFNHLSNFQYAEIIYKTYHKIKNTHNQNNLKLKTNIVILTIEKLYKDNYERISILPIYNIGSEIKNIDFIIDEIKINPNKRIKQKLIYKISDTINAQFIEIVKIKIKNILLQKIKKIDFEDCNIEEIVKIYVDTLRSSYFVFYKVFNKHQNLLNKNTIEFILNREQNEEEYICKIINLILSQKQDFVALGYIRKELAQFKDEASYEKIKQKINKIYQQQEVRHSIDDGVIVSDIAFAALVLNPSRPNENTFTTTLVTHDEMDIGSCDIIEPKLDDVELEQMGNKITLQKTSTVSEGNTTLFTTGHEYNFSHNSQCKTKSFETNQTKTIDHLGACEHPLTKPEACTGIHDNNIATIGSETGIRDNNIAKTEEFKGIQDKQDEDIVKSIVALILKKKFFTQSTEYSHMNIDGIKLDIITKVLTSQRQVVEDIISILVQCQLGVREDLIEYFWYSLKFSADIEISLNFIFTTIKEKLAIDNTALFAKIKKSIKDTDNDAAKILNRIINTYNKLIDKKICLDSYLDVMLYKELDKMLISEEGLKNIFYYFNTPVNIFNFSNFVHDIGITAGMQNKNKITNIFIKFYLKKIKYKFSSLMSILYKNKFNYIDNKYIEKLILFIREIYDTSSGNRQIDGFAQFCKKEILKTLVNADIIKYFSQDNYKKITTVLPEIKNNFVFESDVCANNSEWECLIEDIKYKKNNMLDILKKKNNYDLFVFLNYVYLQKMENMLLKDIFIYKKTNESYKIVNIIFEKILLNKNINLKKIKAIIDFIFINQQKNIYRLENIFEYVLQTIDLVSIFYGTKLKRYFFTYKSEQETLHNDALKDNKDKIYDLYIYNIAALLQTNEVKILNKLKKIETIIGDQENNRNNVKTVEIIQDQNQKELLQEEHTERVCLAEDVKRIYIRNGGLVIMWPFFYGFFEKQHLLDEYNKKIFKNDLARQNAIHALQYLVSSQYRSPDWKVILNKLLCGFKHDDIVASGYVFSEKITIDDDEQQLSPQELKLKIIELEQNADSTINECISNWPEINSLARLDGFTAGMNTNSFRNYFLRRDAFLNIIEQKYDNGVEYNYILDISNKEYDEYVKTIPWNMHKIELPCMPKPIYVRNFDISSEQN